MARMWQRMARHVNNATLLTPHTAASCAAPMLLQDESQRLRRQRDMAQEEATALRMQIATLSARVDELTTAKVQLEKQLIAAQHNGSHANTPG